MPDLNELIEARRAEIHTKTRSLLLEFAEGKISSEQFNILYERFQNQLEMLSTDELLTEANDMNTIAIRRVTTAIALGMGIYHHRSGTIIETLGNFNVPPASISSKLNEISDMLDSRQFIAPSVQKLANGINLFFATRKFTTVILIFRNEPSKQQQQDIERLHHDFEEANQRFLDAQTVDGTKLAKPFLGFVKKKMGDK
jgi:DNA replication protein DnaD